MKELEESSTCRMGMQVSGSHFPEVPEKSDVWQASAQNWRDTAEPVIAVYLNDILEAQEKGQRTWSQWLNRMADYFEEKFGPDWQKEHGVGIR